jgi:uncharacterized glyoxalase superfamily protein PhnB
MPSIAIPCLRYRDTPAAIDWLCEVFGFACQVAVPGIDGAIAHAQLTLGDGMIMLGSVSDEGEYGKVLVQPDEIKGRQTQTVYLQVNDADRVCERARNAGAIILQEPADTASCAATSRATFGTWGRTIRGSRKTCSRQTPDQP